jgi:hypothetical protein
MGASVGDVAAADKTARQHHALAAQPGARQTWRRASRLGHLIAQTGTSVDVT